MICRDCGTQFNPKHKTRGGYIWQCNVCATEKSEKYVGRRLEKCEGIEIFRTSIKYWKGHLQRESRAGFSPNLPVSSPIGLQNWEALKEEKFS